MERQQVNIMSIPLHMPKLYHYNKPKETPVKKKRALRSRLMETHLKSLLLIRSQRG